MLLLQHNIYVSTDEYNYKARCAQLHLESNGEVILKIRNDPENRESWQYCTELTLNHFTVDVPESNTNVIAELKSKHGRRVVLHGGLDGNHVTGYYWRNVLRMCNEMFETYMVVVNGREPGLLLAFHDTFVITTDVKNEVVVIDKEIENLVENGTTINIPQESLTIACLEDGQHYSLVHYLERYVEEPDSIRVLQTDDDMEMFEEDRIEKTMRKTDRSEHLYEKSMEYWRCQRYRDSLRGSTFFHSKLRGNEGIMECIPVSISTDSSTDNVTKYVVPVVSMLDEWFWPHITYRCAEGMLNKHTTNYFIIRMSQSKPGHYALTAAHGVQGCKMFRHFHIKRVGDQEYRFGKKSETFTSFPDIVHHFASTHPDQRPYKTHRSENWRSSIACLQDAQVPLSRGQSQITSQDDANQRRRYKSAKARMEGYKSPIKPLLLAIHSSE